MSLKILMTTPIRVQNSIFIGEVFQIEVSDRLVHWRVGCKNVHSYPARVFMSGEILGVWCKRITSISVQNSIFSAEAFQIEVSDCFCVSKVLFSLSRTNFELGITGFSSIPKIEEHFFKSMFPSNSFLSPTVEGHLAFAD